MLLNLYLVEAGETYTISKLLINDVFECFILEDKLRENNSYSGFTVSYQKIVGKTAIPSGKYIIDISYSQRFKRFLPLLQNVPGFKGVRIHPGNTEKDTEGCLLPGQWTKGGIVTKSVETFNNLFVKLLAATQIGEEIILTIVRTGQEKEQT